MVRYIITCYEIDLEIRHDEEKVTILVWMINYGWRDQDLWHDFFWHGGEKLLSNSYLFDIIIFIWANSYGKIN